MSSTPLSTPLWRRSTQAIAPLSWQPPPAGEYDIHPAFPVPSESITSGFDSLAERIAAHSSVVIDGYGGVIWKDFRERLNSALCSRGCSPVWHCIDTALRSSDRIEALVAPFLGGDDPLWGRRFTGELADFFDAAALDALSRIEASADGSPTILYGSGAALARCRGHLIYLDVPKNEIQFRSRAGSVANLGCSAAQNPKSMYKRFYFVDWPVLNKHRQLHLPAIDTIVDCQRLDAPTFMDGDLLRRALQVMSVNYFRVRPWFEPGPWGGQWLMQKIPSLSRTPANYAWSFELIAPENGIAFTSDGLLLEVAFDTLMHAQAQNVLGRGFEHFGTEFPIRFDYLDTFDGGNLSVQCHPRTEFIQREFGENFTQDETYYIVDCEPGARVYLGFREEIDPDAFRRELDKSASTGCTVDIDRWVNSEPARRGDLFLIPNGTIHCSGCNNLVLEISATPYIFTFKMYDWVRKDLEGNLRPLNIERAWSNLYFDRRGERIAREFVSHPHELACGPDWRIHHLPTHSEHFYDVRRLEFATEITIETNGECHVMNLVRGTAIELITDNGIAAQFNFAETFVVPAAAQGYRLRNLGSGRAHVIQAYLKQYD